MIDEDGSGCRSAEGDEKNWQENRVFHKAPIQFSRRGRRRHFSFHEPNSLSKVHDVDSFESRPATACPAADRLSLFSHDRAAISYATSRPRNHKVNHLLE